MRWPTNVGVWQPAGGQARKPASTTGWWVGTDGNHDHRRNRDYGRGMPLPYITPHPAHFDGQLFVPEYQCPL